MIDPLGGVNLKLSRAKHQLAELERKIDEMIPDDTCIPVPELSSRGKPIIRVKNVPDPDPRLGVIIGDIAHNLRSALDHLVYCLSTPPGASGPADPASPAFPIVSSSAHWKKSRWRLDQARKGTKTRVERLQPYHRRKHPENRLLWQLRELSDIDKHRLLHVAPVAIAGHQVGWKGTGQVAFHGYKVRRGGLKENAIVLEWDIRGEPETEVEVDAQFAVDIAFDSSTPSLALRHELVVPLLRKVGNFIDGVVVPELGQLL